MIQTFLENLFQDREISGKSDKWANWKSLLSMMTCLYCAQQHGKIVDISVLKTKYTIEVHPNCKCTYVPMRIKTPGTATELGINGADVHLVLYGKLPEYYISKSKAESIGWEKWKGNLDDVLPEKMIGGDVYKNKDEKLPQSGGRIWYEADINYKGGYRNNERILYSNDGLIFVSYDHYQTFYELAI